MSGTRTHERIRLGDSWRDITLKLSEANPGAIMVCARLIQDARGFDLASPLGILQAFLAIDDAAVFGEKLYLLFHDLCGDDVLKTLTVLRALDARVISPERLHLELDAAVSGTGGELDHVGLLAGVLGKWPQFGKVVGG